MITESDIKTGDLFLCKSNSFLSKAIVKFMYKYAKDNKIKIKKEEIFSHAGIFIRTNDNILRIAEAVENGFRIREFTKYYKLDNQKNCVLRLKFDISDYDILKIEKEIYRLQEINISYQFWNFLQWINFIIFKRNLFQNSERFLYCYEAAYRIYAYAFPFLFPDYKEKIDFFKLYDLTKFMKL